MAADAEANDERNLSDAHKGRTVASGFVDALARLLRLPTRVVVVGPSMIPTLEDGDRCLVRRTRRVESGDLVVFIDPEYPRRLVVKRVVVVSSSGIDVAGDNSGESRDSRSFGPVPASAVIGVAWYRYAPAGRVGRIA